MTTILKRARIVVALGAALATSGCAGVASTIKALAQDPASACVAVQSPYASVYVARATPGAKVSLAAGSCTVEVAPGK